MKLDIMETSILIAEERNNGSPANPFRIQSSPSLTSTLTDDNTYEQFVNIPELFLSHNMSLQMYSGRKLLSQSAFHYSPIYVLAKGFYVVGSLKTVISNEGMLEDIHHQGGNTTRRMPYLVLVDPLI